jgi:ElaB/YqjD/DUF883 family membrane-anchored ribosome-binding protein
MHSWAIDLGLARLSVWRYRVRLYSTTWSTRMNDTTLEQRERLVTDLKAVISDAEELLHLTADQAGEGAVKLRERVQARLTQARERLAAVQATAVERAKAAGQAADHYVHEKPWQAIGAAAAVGMVIGLLIGRR